jgi:L-asparaginase
VLVSHARPVVALFTTGGTIAAIGHDRTDLTRYGETGRTVAGSDLVAGIPELGELAEIRVRAVVDAPSHDLSGTDLLRIAEAIEECAGDPTVVGVVVTHGTNTLEETAYFLDLTHIGPLPVVVTGAMRPASALSPDGPANLVAAVKLALDPQTAGAGVLVALNDEFHAAAEVTKAASSGVAAFASPRLGAVGRLHPAGRVELGPVRRRPAIAPATGLGPLPRVDIVTSHLDADGALIDAAVSAGATGLVVAATGGGFLPTRQEEALHEAVAAGVAVMVTTRTGSGPVTRVCPPGFLPGGDLQPWKARMLLIVALAAGWSADRIGSYLRD